MDENTFIIKIKELGHINSKRDELLEYCKLKFDKIVKYLPRRILNSDGGDLLDCILNGVPDNSSCKNKVKIVDIVLQIMRKESTSLTHCGDVISRLCLELPRLQVDDLVRWSNYSVQSIIDDNDVNMIWKDVLPECLSALSLHDKIKHCGTEMTISEYKEQCIHTLCHSRWKETQLVQLTAMFKDIQISRSDHKQVVNKICSYMIDTPPDSLPPLVHQLLKLCKTFDVEIVLAHLSYYFNVRVYSKLEPPPQDSESTTMDIDDIAQHSPAELSRCLSTCLYHIAQGTAEPELIRKQIKSWPKTQLLRAPFLVDLALALSDKGADFRTICLEVIKSSIEQRISDTQRSNESAWVRSVLPPDVDVAGVLKVLTTESGNHRQLTVIGLINLAFYLLSVPKTKPVAQTCWSHGKLILVRLSKSQPETAGHILSQLADRLAGDSNQRQYADCLYVLCKLTPLSVERCSQLGLILENCQPSPTEYRTAAAVLDAVHPLINFSTRTRDILVMVCRKGLYSRDSLHRCLALSGFLTVLRNIKLPRGTFSSSQSDSDQFSAHSYLTQLTVDVHATNQGATVTSRVRNEAMCMEVVSIVRRCLLQDSAVKQLLYTNLYDCAHEKLVLHESILEMLYEHLSKYLPESGDNGPPLLFDKCVQINGITAVLVEPISNLLYTISQFLQPCEDEDLEDILTSQGGETGSAYLKSKLTNIMDQLCNSDSFGQIDMENPGLTDLTPESKAKCLKVQQIVQCYETLIAYQLMQWTSGSTNSANVVYNSYKAYNQLLDQTKVTPKIGKKSNSNLALNETKETNKSQKSQKTQKEKAKAPVKLSSLTKDRAGPFKPLPCVWDLKLCLRIIELLYSENVSWSSIDQRNQLRCRRDFHHWVIRCVQSVLSTEHLKKQDVIHYVVKIAAVMFKRCISRFQDMCEFDDQTTLGCVELFKTCLTLLLSSNYSLKIDSFLPKITSLTESTSSASIAAILEQIHIALNEIEDESNSEERDILMTKLTNALIQTTNILLEIPTNSCSSLNSVILKLEDYVRKSNQDCISLLPSLLFAGCREQQEVQLLDDLLMKLTTALGRIDEDDTSVAEESSNFPSIDSRNGQTVLSHVCIHLGHRLKCCEHLLIRARDLGAALNYAADANQHRINRELKEVYKCIVLQLCQLSSWMCACCKLRCSVGGSSDRVLCAAMRHYSLLASLVGHLPPDLAAPNLLRLDRLLKLSGKKLSSATDNLITFLEASQQQQSASRVLRDTKLIPRLVLAAEQFSRNVILLANKAKVEFQQYLSLGTARDFRIRAPVLQEALGAREHRCEDHDATDNENEDINDATTEVLSLLEENPQEEEVQKENGRKKKRKRVS